MSTTGVQPSSDLNQPQRDALVEAEAQSQEDVIVFLMSQAAITTATGDLSRPRVLEVAQVWGQAVLDVKQYAANTRPVTLGNSTGHRWRYLGRPVAWVPAAFKRCSWMLGPGLSEVEEEWRQDFHASPDDLPSAEHELFAWEEDHFVLNFSEAWQGFAQVGETRYSFAELIASGQVHALGGGTWRLDLGPDTKIVVDIGHMSFFSHLVHPGKAVRAQMAENLDYPFLGAIGFAAFLLVMAALMVMITPPKAENQVQELNNHYVELMLQTPPEPPKALHAKDADPDAGGSKQSKPDEGKVGREDSKKKNTKGSPMELKKRELDKEIAENSGVLAAMSKSNMSDLLGTTLSTDLTAGIGELIGASGTQMGGNAMGSRGSGLGGDGSIAGLGGGGHGVGTRGKGSGYGTGGGTFGEKPIGGKISHETPLIVGSLDSSLIDAVIKRNMNQIRYCYQRELTKDPGLMGKIVTRFVIGKDGRVSAADTKSSSMSNASVESCITSRLLTYEFPQPKGNGIVIVSYPFLFAPG